MDCNSSEPVAKKVKIYSHDNQLSNSLPQEDEMTEEICTNSIAWSPSCSSREMPTVKPRAILHDKYYASLETGQYCSEHFWFYLLV